MFCGRHTSSHDRLAFSLIDTIIAVAVLSISILGITSLTLVSIQANQFNSNRLKAYYFAQEGLEAVRNMRDSNWLQNYEWNAKAADNLGNSGSFIGQPFPFRIPSPDSTKPGIYVIEPYLDFKSATDVPTDSAPWVWQYFTTLSDYQNQLATNPSAIIPGVRCELSVQNTWTCSQSEPFFRRYLAISYPPTTPPVMLVESVVSFSERGMDKEMRLKTELTDWRKGPL